jgi:hypothetical protein
MVVVALLGIADLLAAWLVTDPTVFVDLAFVLGIFHLIKGISSIVGSVIFGISPLWIWMDLTDLLTGLTLLFFWQLPWLWIPLVLKGTWSLFIGW